MTLSESIGIPDRYIRWNSYRRTTTLWTARRRKIRILGVTEKVGLSECDRLVRDRRCGGWADRGVFDPQLLPGDLEHGLFSSFWKAGLAEPNHQRNASCRNADGFRDAYRGPCALGRHRTGTRSIGEHNYGISDGLSHNGSSSRGFGGT